MFRVSEPLSTPHVDAVVTLETDVADRPLLLDCSLRNFSEGPQADGSFGLTSTNTRFFRGGLELPMTTIFWCWKRVIRGWSAHRCS